MTANNISLVKQNTAGTLMAMSDSTAPVNTTTSAQSNYGLPIEDLLKRLGKNILRFNTGGFVPFVNGAVKGIDSILAKLTPEEYVISAPAVRSV